MYLSILATDALEPGWPSILTELESSLQAHQLDADSAASVALNMAVRYAALGDAEAALTKYSYFTETLNYQADFQSKLSLAAHLINAGEAEAGLEIVQDGNPNNRTSYSASALHAAAAALGRSLGLLGSGGAAQPEVFDVSSAAEYFAPVSDPGTRARHASSASSVEAALDALAATAPVDQLPIGLSGIDGSYGILALVHQKLGAADRAAAAIAKAEQAPQRPTQGRPDGNREIPGAIQDSCCARPG